jgi:hypothetical protein
LTENVVDAEINQTYSKLKAVLVQKKCRITAEISPTSLIAVEGSIWGTSAKTAQKRLTFTLRQDDTQTHITSTAQMISRYRDFTLVGVILSLVLLSVCVWMALDLQSSNGFWSWLAQTRDGFDVFKAEVFIRLTSFLALFLLLSLALEAYVIVKVRSGIMVVAQEIATSVKV